jgi:transformer-2 protein
MRDPHTKEHRGFAFVTMETTEDAERCKSNLAGYRINGRPITVDTVSSLNSYNNMI